MILTNYKSCIFPRSTSNLNELREIFEQAESRRQSCEENNNSIRTSIKNLASTLAHESTEEEIICPSSTQDEEVLEPPKVSQLDSTDIGRR